MRNHPRILRRLLKRGHHIDSIPLDVIYGALAEGVDVSALAARYAR